MDCNEINNSYINDIVIRLFSDIANYAISKWLYDAVADLHTALLHSAWPRPAWGYHALESYVYARYVAIRFVRK